MELFELTRERGATVIVPTMQRLDAGVAPAFKQAVVQLIEGGDTQLVLDLHKVDFLDSSGLGAMVSILKALGNRGVVAVCNARGAVHSLFKLTRMDKVFPIWASREEALTKLAG